jgi:hypothetical protein
MSHAPHIMSLVCNGVENSARKEPTMKTFLQTRATFLETLAQLERLAGPEQVTQALRVVKERETGKLCYQAEEDLPSAELSLLKDMLSVENSTWETYKQQCRASLRTWNEQESERYGKSEGS